MSATTAASPDPQTTDKAPSASRSWRRRPPTAATIRSPGTASRWSTESSSAWDEALQTFTTLRTTKPDYVAMYLMCGQMLDEAGRKDEAREWLESGLSAAKARATATRRREIESALALLD